MTTLVYNALISEGEICCLSLLGLDGLKGQCFTEIYRKSSIKPPGGYLFQAHLLVGGLIEAGDLFNLEKAIVSVLHRELEYKMEKLKYKKVGGQATEDQNQTRTSSC